MTINFVDPCIDTAMVQMVPPATPDDIVYKASRPAASVTLDPFVLSFTDPQISSSLCGPVVVSAVRCAAGATPGPCTTGTTNLNASTAPISFDVSTGLASVFTTDELLDIGVYTVTLTAALDYYPLTSTVYF